ncbi:MAG: ribulokinase [Lentisphaerae bacterium]|nr:ribulokinase [Lentisphaerota bacterium]
MKHYALGLDYGTNSCRAVIVDVTDGREVAGAVYAYPGGEMGILLDAKDPNLARQHPRDYLEGTTAMVADAVAQARDADADFDPARLVGIGIDATGSTPLPVDAGGTPLGLKPEFEDNLDAMAWLWKDHTGHSEAAHITALAERMRPQYLAKCGGTYSSEWFWSKILHCKNAAPDVFAAAHSFVEHCDYMPALLAGDTDPAKLARSVCTAGHKAMYADAWGGLPDAAFLDAVDPALAALRDRLYTKAVPSNHRAGRLCEAWAEKLGLKPGTAIAVGALDAHLGAVGSGIREGTLVKILGTSSCDLMVQPATAELPDIPGVCGIVKGSVLPDAYGIEAGQSAVGDIFLWFVDHLVPESYGRTQDEKFKGLAEAASRLRAGETGLLALDWNHGNRTILTDVRLSGLLVGQTLHTAAHEMYRALIEATAFGALTIMKRVEEYGVAVNEIVTCGGLAVKNPLLMQIYADVTNRPMKIARSDQACALGAAIYGAVAAGRRAGGFATVAEAQEAVCGVRETVYTPDPGRNAVYRELYGLYRDLHDAFGTAEWSGRLNHVMKNLIAIRERERG